MRINFLCFIFIFYSVATLGTTLHSTPKKALEPSLDPKKIDLLVWNIKKAEAGVKWQKDYDRLLFQHDLVAIQEASFKPNKKTMASNVEVARQDGAVSFYSKNKIGTGVATVSKIDPLKIKPLESPDREPFLHTPKMSLLTTYKIQGSSEDLLLVNTHAINFVSNEKFERQMLDIAKYIHSHKGPVAWVGDFNTWSDARLKILYKVVESLKVQSIF